MENKNNWKDTVISLGICAMEKKIKSQHMQKILTGLSVFEEFKIIVFTEEILFNYDVEVLEY